MARRTILSFGGLPASPSFSGTLTVGGQILAADGSSGAPGIAFASAPTTGFYVSGGSIYFSQGGTASWRLGGNNGIDLGSTQKLNWCSGSPGTSVDLSLVRQGVGSLKIASAPVATANYGMLSLGSGAFDGAAAGFFVGSASGTVLAINAASGFAGNLIDAQVAGGATQFRVGPAGDVTLKAGSGVLLTTTTALTNGAAAQIATITNGPTAGNPTKWIPINDNGTTRYIPAW